MISNFLRFYISFTTCMFLQQWRWFYVFKTNDNDFNNNYPLRQNNDLYSRQQCMKISKETTVQCKITKHSRQQCITLGDVSDIIRPKCKQPAITMGSMDWHNPQKQARLNNNQLITEDPKQILFFAKVKYLPVTIIVENL